MADQPSRRKRGRPPHPDILTPREWQVLDLLRQDLTNEQIAQRLDISYATAKYHVSEIISKLGVQTREGAAAWPMGAEPRRLDRLIAWLASKLSHLKTPTLAKAAILGGSVAALAGLSLIAWVSWGTDSSDDSVLAEPSAIYSPTFSTTSTPLREPTNTAPNAAEPPEPFAYSSFPWRPALYSIDPESGRVDILLDPPPYAYDWSPDGTQLAYVAGASLNTMTLASADGDPIRSITVDQFDSVGKLSWSPDSSHIAFDGSVLEPRLEFPGESWLVPAIAVLDVSTDATRIISPPSCFSNDSGRTVSSQLEWMDATSLVVEISAFGVCGSGESVGVLDLSGNLRTIASGRGTSLSPDGEYLALGVNGVNFLPLKGGVALPALTEGGYVAEWSPTGQQLLYISHDGSSLINVVNRDGSGAHVLTDGAQPKWAPDGSRITFLRGGNVFTIGVDGASEQQITETPLPLFYRPTWSPDSQRVLVQYSAHSNTFTVDASSGVPTLVAPGYSPRWSPDAQWIAFFASVDFGGIGGGGNLFVMRPDGTDIRRLPIRTGYSDVISGCSYAELQWSIESTQIVIDRGFSGTAITTLDPGGSPRDLGRACSALSPDVTREAFTTAPNSDGSCSVVVQAIGEVVDNTGRGSCGIPKWSPNGSQLAYVSNNQILVVASDGGAPRAIANLENIDYSFVHQLEWSGDGTRVAYLGDGLIQVANVSEPNDTVTLPRPEGLHPDAFKPGTDGHGPEAGVSEPEWSPDGQELAFTLYRSTKLSGFKYGSREIYVTAADGSGTPRRIARGYDPQWSPDGTLIAFSRDAIQ